MRNRFEFWDKQISKWLDYLSKHRWQARLWVFSISLGTIYLIMTINKIIEHKFGL
jgi:hypothetical protein